MVMVVRFLATRSRAACTFFSPRTSMALVASSRIRIFGLRTIERAMAILWRWPPDSLAPLSPTWVS